MNKQQITFVKNHFKTLHVVIKITKGRKPFTGKNNEALHEPNAFFIVCLLLPGGTTFFVSFILFVVIVRKRDTFSHFYGSFIQ